MTKQKKYLKALYSSSPLIMDGAMGTQIQKFSLTDKDFLGSPGFNEILNLTRPEIISKIHLSYLEAGANIIETNSFGANRLKLQEYSAEQQTAEINFTAAQIARKVAGPEKLVLGSIGPTGILLSHQDQSRYSFDDLVNVFEEQALALIKGGVDALLLETQHDILEVKAGIIGCKKAIAQSDVALQVQVTVDTYGKMLFGTHLATAAAIVQDMGIDVFGLNCSTGPQEMEPALKILTQNCSLPISVIPNAGMPKNKDGQAFYDLSVADFVASLKKYVTTYGVNIIGGCCGTSPEYIQALAQNIQPSALLTTKKYINLPFCSSTHLSSRLKQPLIIGERINSQGSKKAKQLMLANDYDSLIDLAESQQNSGADLIDLCFAMTERNDEKEQMQSFIKLCAYRLNIPFCFDSTEPLVLENSIKAYPGKPLINSINLESDKIYQILPFLKTFGLSTIALCIDEKGMAKTRAEKVQIAQRIYQLAVHQFGLKPEQLYFDPLTFTLATGDNEYKHSAQSTFEALRDIKKLMPGVKTVLGVSNVSFGFSPPSRKVLNLVYLYEAVKYGLDSAIFNIDHLLPREAIDKRAYELGLDLLYAQKENALSEFIEYFQETRANTTILPPTSTQDLSLEECIIFRKKTNLEKKIDELLLTQTPETIINKTLLPAMKIVGEKMDKGEIILPFVLESAEVMKKALNYLEPLLKSSQGFLKGSIVLATVYGDVHDIGKNLVKTITENNGYKVIDLGKQVPADLIIETAIREKVDAISLSALLVTTSKQMQIIVQKLHHAGQNIPIIIGGAAINQEFAQTISQIDGEIYKGGVYYSKDAFSGLKILEELTHAKN